MIRAKWRVRTLGRVTHRRDQRQVSHQWLRRHRNSTLDQSSPVHRHWRPRLRRLRRHRRPRRSTQPPSAPGSIESSGVLAREAALIDGARVSVARGDLRSAEQTLEVYASSREIGVLDREALLLQIEIALQRDERVRAAALVERFATVYPSDPRVLSLRARLERRARP